MSKYSEEGRVSRGMEASGKGVQKEMGLSMSTGHKSGGVEMAGQVL